MASKEKDYSVVPLAQKLGIISKAKLQPERMSVLLINAPKGSENTLGDLPPYTHIASKKEKEIDVILYFEKDKSIFLKELKMLSPLLSKKGGLWIAWPKKTSGVLTDLSFEVVQQAGLALGLVDNKVCAIDGTWTALRFVHRKQESVS